MSRTRLFWSGGRLIAFSLAIVFCAFASGRGENSSLAVLDADTGIEVFGTFNFEGDIVNLAELPPNLTIVDYLYLVDAQSVQSVEFVFDGNHVRVENVAPYVIGGDNPPGSYRPFKLPVGQHSLTTNYFSLPNAGGALIDSITVEFEVIDVEPVDFFITPDRLVVSVPAGEKTTVLFSVVLAPKAPGPALAEQSMLMGIAETEVAFDLSLATPLPSWASLDSPIHVGENVLGIDAGPLTPGIYQTDPIVVVAKAQGVPYSQFASFSIWLDVTPTDKQFVTGFTLVDAVSDLDRSPSYKNDVSYDFFSMPESFNIRADTSPAEVGSVLFELDFQPIGGERDPVFKVFRTENVSPYALFGDSPKGNYHGQPRQAGTYYIRATPYSKSNAMGEAGQPRVFKIYVYGGPS